MKNNKGITLIALVVTIIVLLILAGISIMMLSGDNGILTKAKDAKDITEEAQDLEILNMKILESSLDDGTPNINTLIPQLQEMGCTVSGESYPLSVELKGKNYQIDSKGTLKNVGSTEELTKEENYLIVMESSKSKFVGKTNVGTIEEFRESVNSGTFNYTTAYLYENIELNGSETNPWAPIGTETNKFSKVLDGRDYSINGIYANSSNQGQALFNYNTGTIQNITVNGTINRTAIGVAGIVAQNEGIVENCTSNVTIVGNEYVGGVVGYNLSTGIVRNCTSNGTVTGAQVVGGIVGESDGNVIGCTNNGNVQSTSENASTLNQYLTATGGIVGYSLYGSVSNCRNLKEVRSASDNTGGIVGSNYNSSIQCCYNEGIVQGTNNAGGIVGFQDGGSKQNTLISNCYNKQNISAKYRIGGIIGTFYNGIIENCYNTGNVISIDNFTDSDIGGICACSRGDGSIINCYMLSSSNIEIIGIDEGNTLDEKSAKKTQSEMQSNEFVTTINSTGNSYKKGSTYPILSWE